MIYDRMYGIADAMELERMVAAALGVKNYKPTVQASSGFGKLVQEATKK